MTTNNEERRIAHLLDVAAAMTGAAWPRCGHGDTSPSARGWRRACLHVHAEDDVARKLQPRIVRAASPPRPGTVCLLDIVPPSRQSRCGWCVTHAVLARDQQTPRHRRHISGNAA
ncbi:hypothetical protein L3D22_04840 [Lysobacter soli]|uniref:hypothetical protein n=1 Tax=Lysobacter soli TaxID=453783 RepID=UPI0020A17004|nr:hypothetical protein [Lysobacter soli]MDG2519282.1 hypothetical protein [Lysobacter soli]UTA55166.1 hypothetical protein L3D22_04840 [Lysobacter soli]